MIIESQHLRNEILRSRSADLMKNWIAWEGWDVRCPILQYGSGWWITKKRSVSSLRMMPLSLPRSLKKRRNASRARRSYPIRDHGICGYWADNGVIYQEFQENRWHRASIAWMPLYYFMPTFSHYMAQNDY